MQSREIFTQKREKFRINIRQKQREIIFQKKRIEKLGVQVQNSNIEPEQLREVLASLQDNKNNYESINSYLIQFADCASEQKYIKAFQLNIHLALLDIIIWLPIHSKTLPLSLRILSNILFYSDQAIEQLAKSSSKELVDLLSRLSCQVQYFQVSDLALAVMGNFVSQIIQPQIELLSNDNFFNFWNQYLQSEKNLDCLTKRMKRLIWVVRNLTNLTSTIKQIDQFLGPLTIIKFAIDQIQFDSIDIETGADIIVSLRKILKICEHSFMDELFNEDMAEQFIKLIKISQNDLVDIKLKIEASKTIEVISRKLSPNLLSLFYNNGLQQTLTELLISQDYQYLGLKLLTNLLNSDYQLIDQIFTQLFEDFYLFKILIKLIHNENDMISLKAIVAIKFGIDMGSCFIYQKFLDEEILYYIIKFLDEKSLEKCKESLEIILSIQQKEVEILSDQNNQFSHLCQQYNLQNTLELLITKIFDEEIICLCNLIVNNINWE